MSTASDWADLRRRLQLLAQRVGEEIHSYPAPITACDAQFNHLLDLRRLLPRELERLDAAARSADASAEEFIRSSPLSAELLAVAAP
jgi:hypothetical protein